MLFENIRRTDATTTAAASAGCDAGPEHVEIADRLVREHSIREFAERFPDQAEAAVAAVACAFKRIHSGSCLAAA